MKLPSPLLTSVPVPVSDPATSSTAPGCTLSAPSTSLASTSIVTGAFSSVCVVPSSIASGTSSVMRMSIAALAVEPSASVTVTPTLSVRSSCPAAGWSVRLSVSV